MAPLEAGTEGMLTVTTQPLHAVIRYSHSTRFLPYPLLLIILLHLLHLFLLSIKSLYGRDAVDWPVGSLIQASAPSPQ